MADKKITELDPVPNLTALATLYLVQDGVDYKTTLGNLSTSLPNSVNSGATGFGVSSDITTPSGTISQSKTVIPLTMGVSTPITLANDTRQGAIKILVNKTTVPAVINLVGLGFTQASLTGLGSSVTLVFLDTNWVILSSYNTTIS